MTDAGIVRLVDLLIVERADGSLETLDAPPVVPEGLGGIAAAAERRRRRGRRRRPGRATAAFWSLGDAMPLGSVAAVALIEHTWAGPMRDAIREARAAPLEETWLGPGDIEHLEELLAARSR